MSPTTRLYDRRARCSHGPTAAGPSRIARSIPTPSGLSAAVAMGAHWWECRSAHAAMWALRKSGVRFRTLVHNNGTERWWQPRLAPWEVPRGDPAAPRPNASDVAAQRRAARQRWLARQRARNAGTQTAEQEPADWSRATHKIAGSDLINVRFGPLCGLKSDISRGPRSAISCREQMQQMKWRLFAYSITSLARASSIGGISRPSALAVVRLMMRSNLVGCSTGMSLGFTPRRILST